MRAARRAADVAATVQDIVRRYTEEFGYRTGLDKFARLVGVTPRRARSLYQGDAQRIDAAEYLSALDAEGTLNRARRERLRAELSELERGHLDAVGAEGRRTVRALDALDGGPRIGRRGRRDPICAAAVAHAGVRS